MTISLSSLRLEWRDNRLDFKFLKDDNERNVISGAKLEHIWHPRIHYFMEFEDHL